MVKSKNYESQKIEKHWQEVWEAKKTNLPEDMLKVKNKFYNLWMFPYPSAEGLHAGHAFASTGSDVYGRFMRMKGREVFQPIGYDSFGIHSENFAIKIRKHPGEIIEKTTKHYESQLRSLGHGYDWTRTVTTSDIDYYRWTQWIFVQMFKAGLAYRNKLEVNWCPSCKTVLADEQVMTPAQAGKDPKDREENIIEAKEGMMVCERCGTLVEKKELEQWLFRITDYADRLLKGLEKIDWPEKIKIAQKNWIGKKDGINIEYPVIDTSEVVTCFTTAPVNFGMTFIVLAPNHSLVQKIILGKLKVPKANLEKVKKYVNRLDKKGSNDKQKTGTFTGLYADNRVAGWKVPIWISDFVVGEVGTGAVQGCPGHDYKDFEFAKKFGIPIKRVVIGPNNDASEIKNPQQVIIKGMPGKMINSRFLDGLEFGEALQKTMNYIEQKGWGKRVTSYHLRDWLISRQRYWGPPIPMIYCKKCATEEKSWFTLQGQSFKGDWNHFGWWPEENLPVALPEIKDYQPEGTGRGPLANHPEFYEVKCPSCGGAAVRETDVSDTFLDSSWYHMRYPSASLGTSPSTHSGLRLSSAERLRSGQVPFDPEITKKWLPVDFYFGGAEHSVLHLMYARFVGMFLHDLGLIDWEEPYPRFYAHGLMIKDGAKMSKSRGNVVNPDEYVTKYGADTLRLYLMFMGPMDGYPDFRDTGIEGMRRFTERIWSLYCSTRDVVTVKKEDAKNILIQMHKAIKKVTEDIENFRYNTAISAIMELVNLLKKSQNSNLKTKIKIKSAELTEALETLVLLLAPFAPHMAEELWVNVLGKDFSIHKQPWPKFDPKLVKEEKVTIPVQVNGKLRSTLRLRSGQAYDKDFVVSCAEKDEKVVRWLEQKEIKNVVFVPGKLLNFVV